MPFSPSSLLARARFVAGSVLFVAACSGTGSGSDSPQGQAGSGSAMAGASAGGSASIDDATAGQSEALADSCQVRQGSTGRAVSSNASSALATSGAESCLPALPGALRALRSSRMGAGLDELPDLAPSNAAAEPSAVAANGPSTSKVSAPLDADRRASNGVVRAPRGSTTSSVAHIRTQAAPAADPASGPALTGSLDEALETWERRMILDALQRTHGVQARAARILGVSERSLWYRIKKLGIQVRTPDDDAPPA